MKNKKLLVSILLSLLALCTVFSGCRKDEPAPVETGSGTEAVTDAPAPDNQYNANTPGAIDLSEYTIVRAADASQEIIKATSQLRGYLNSYCGLDIVAKTDDKDAKGKEILVGKTNRTASLAAYEGMKERNWSVTLADGNIVLASGTDATMNLATTWMQNNCLQEGNKYALLGTGNSFTYNYPLTSVTVGETKISDMSIAYLDADNVGYVDAAYMLAYDILDRFGEPVNVTSYNPVGEQKQILVASATQAKKYFDNLAIGTNQYVVMENNGGIAILANDATGADMGVQALINACKASTDGKVNLATVCSNDVKTVNFGTDTLALMDGAEYRIMSFNVWRFHFQGATGDKTARLAAAKNTMLYYSPDVVGFQEYCQEWTADYTSWLTDNGYTVIGNDKVSEQDNADTFYREDQNFAPLAFKTAKFELVASGWQRLNGTYDLSAEYANYYPGHNVTWAVLKDKTTNKQMIVTSTHFYQHNGDPNADAVRVSCSEQVVNLVKGLKEQYQCAVIAVGDYNMRENSNAYAKVVESGFLSDARYVATKEYAVVGGYHENGQCVVSAGTATAIDHAFVTGEVEVIRHKLGLSQMTADAADHFPLLIDIAPS